MSPCAKNDRRTSLSQRLSLFRSAALSWTDRVIGVVMSGHLDDATDGLGDTKASGAIAVVQAPRMRKYPHAVERPAVRRGRIHLKAIPSPDERGRAAVPGGARAL